MRLYGLVDGRGTLTATDLAKKILYPYDESERKKARSEAWLRVPLIEALYEQLHGEAPPEDEQFAAILGKITGAERDII